MKKQKISEYVGMGHPDRVADYISNIYKENSVVSATETIVNKAGAYVSGETTFKNDSQKTKADKLVRGYINQIRKDYGFKPLVKLTTNFIEQDSMLADRKSKKLSGDQEVVYFHKLTKKDVHFHLKEIDELVNKITNTYDYKTLVNLKNNTANLSISTTHIKFKKVRKLITNELSKRFKNIKINVCEFAGGSIINDTGVTGRKLLVEKEGTGFAHGGGAYFGKDSTKAAVWGYDKLKQSKYKDSVIVYFPGDDLDKPNYIGKL